MLSPSNFRDKKITEIAIKYGWDGSLHSASISVCDKNDHEQTFCLNGLLEFSIYDDFSELKISQVKIVYIADQIYLSLDPFEELNEIADYEKDNVWFQFTNVELRQNLG